MARFTNISISDIQRFRSPFYVKIIKSFFENNLGIEIYSTNLKVGNIYCEE